MMSETRQLIGTTKTWKENFGFLVSDEVAGDIFVGARDNPKLGGRLRPGEQVVFVLTTGNNGKPHASNAERVEPFELPSDEASAWAAAPEPPPPPAEDYWNSGQPAPPESLSLPTPETFPPAPETSLPTPETDAWTLTGTLASFKGGWGLIACEDLPERLWVGDKDNPQIKEYAINVGEEVTFEVGVNSANGKNKAVNVWPVVPRPPRAAAPNAAPSVQNAGGLNGGAGARDRSRTPMGAPGKRMIGWVKNFRDLWGFITSDQHPGDIYVSIKDNHMLQGPLSPGEQVEFELATRAGERGSHNGARAVNVTRVNGIGHAPPRGALAYGHQPQVVPPPPGRGHAPPPPPPPTFRHAPPPPQQCFKGFKGGMKGGAPASPAFSPNQRHSGTMKSTKEGWGFVTCATAQGDVFLGLRDNPQLAALPAVGDELTFELTLDPKSGRYKALNVQASLKGMRVQGTVTKVREEGWGFATTADVEGNVMLGKRNLMAAGIDFLQVGQVLEYDIHVGPKGYEAVNIQAKF